MNLLDRMVGRLADPHGAPPGAVWPRPVSRFETPDGRAPLSWPEPEAVDAALSAAEPAPLPLPSLPAHPPNPGASGTVGASDGPRVPFAPLPGGVSVGLVLEPAPARPAARRGTARHLDPAPPPGAAPSPSQPDAPRSLQNPEIRTAPGTVPSEPSGAPPRPVAEAELVLPRPPGPRAGPTAPVRLPGTTEPAADPVTPAPPAVEITIGRIEIRAARTPAAPPEAAPIPAVSTLDEYLRRRARSR